MSLQHHYLNTIQFSQYCADIYHDYQHCVASGSLLGNRFLVEWSSALNAYLYASSVSRCWAGKGNEPVEARLNNAWTQSDQGRVQKLSHSARCWHQVRRIPTQSGTLPEPFLIKLVNVRLSSMVSQLDQASKRDWPSYPSIRYVGYQWLHTLVVLSNIHSATDSITSL